MLAKAPADRPQTMRDLAAELASIEANAPAAPEPLPRIKPGGTVRIPRIQTTLRSSAGEQVPIIDEAAWDVRPRRRWAPVAVVAVLGAAGSGSRSLAGDVGLFADGRRRAVSRRAVIGGTTAQSQRRPTRAARCGTRAGGNDGCAAGGGRAGAARSAGAETDPGGGRPPKGSRRHCVQSIRRRRLSGQRPGSARKNVLRVDPREESPHRQVHDPQSRLPRAGHIGLGGRGHEEAGRAGKARPRRHRRRPELREPLTCRRGAPARRQ